MDESRAAQMDEEERAAFLGRGGTGVISFPMGADDPPHTIPVSYGYDEPSGHFYFRLAVGPESKKPPGGPVSFVAYDQTEGGWRSVVAVGRLEAIEETAVTDGVLEELRRVDIPLYDVFDHPPKETAFEFFRLDPDRVTDRKEAAAGN